LAFRPRSTTRSTSWKPKRVIRRARSASSSSSVRMAPPSNVLRPSWRGSSRPRRRRSARS
jgi:hypothetical protein